MLNSLYTSGVADQIDMKSSRIPESLVDIENASLSPLLIQR